MDKKDTLKAAKLFEDNVAVAKKLTSIKSYNQMEIGRLAYECCEITWGGAQHVGKFTLKRFAFKIGVSAKTLSNWVSVYHNVFLKLTPKQKREMTFTTLNLVGRTVSKTTPVNIIQSKADKIGARGNLDTRILGYLSDTSGILMNLKQRNGALKCDDETLEEVLFYAQSIVDVIKEDRKDIKAKNNHLTKIYRRNAVSSAAAALCLPREFRITDKDMKIINYMRKKNYCSPTDIGVTVGNYKKSNATAWSLRTLQKLEEHGYVEKQQGKYKLTRNAASL